MKLVDLKKALKLQKEATDSLLADAVMDLLGAELGFEINEEKLYEFIENGVVSRG